MYCGDMNCSAGFPSGVYRSQWLNDLHGYSRDLDWSVDNINDQNVTTLDNIYTHIKENWEYRRSNGEPRVLRYEVFKNNIGQHEKKTQMKMRIMKSLYKPKSMRLDHWCNMVEHIRNPKKIEQANVMREARKCVKKMSTFGQSEGEMRARLVSTLATPN